MNATTKKTAIAREPAAALAQLQEELAEQKAASDRLAREHKAAAARAEDLEHQLAELRRVASDQRRLVDAYGAEEPGLRERWGTLRDYVERRLRMTAGALDEAARAQVDKDVAEAAATEEERRTAVAELQDKVREWERRLREATAQVAARQQHSLELGRYGLRLKERLEDFEKARRDVDRAEQEGKLAELYRGLRQLEQSLAEAEPLTPERFRERIRDTAAALAADRKELDAAQRELQRLQGEIARREGGGG